MCLGCARIVVVCRVSYLAVRIVDCVLLIRGVCWFVVFHWLLFVVCMRLVLCCVVCCCCVFACPFVFCCLFCLCVFVWLCSVRVIRWCVNFVVLLLCFVLWCVCSRFLCDGFVVVCFVCLVWFRVDVVWCGLV